MNQANYKNTTTDEEVLSRDDARLRALLADLKRVEAPADFDFRVKARIAAEDTNYEKSATQLFRVLRYALPLALVLLVSAFAVLNGVYFSDERSVPAIAERQIQTLTPRIAPTSENVLSPLQDAASAGIPTFAKVEAKNIRTPAIASRGQKPKARVSLDEIANEETSGSSASAASTAPRVITPPGINPYKTVETSPDAESAKPITGKEILSQLGIEAVFADDTWRVKSVSPNSLAERSGVKPNDRIEAIDDEKFTDKPLKRRTLEGKKLTVGRGGEKIEISLTNQLTNQ